MSRYNYHGLSSHPLYGTWEGIRARCNNPNSPNYSYYGGRGIKLCDRWNNFANFLGDMGEKPTPLHSIDRIDVNADYEPTNCQWATKRQQSVNRRVRSNNTSGITGIQWDKFKKRWKSLIVNPPGSKTKTTQRYFRNLDEAKEYNSEARRKVYGI